MELKLSYKGNYKLNEADLIQASEEKGLSINELEGIDIDEECRDLCDALNSLPGIKTTDSCSGHGREPFVIFFMATDFRGLNFLARCIDPRYWEYGHQWTIKLENSDVAEDGQLFLLESASIDLDELKIQVESLINSMNHHLNNKAYIKSFLGDYDGFIAFKPINGKCCFTKRLMCQYFQTEEDIYGGEAGWCQLDYAQERTDEQVLKVASHECLIENLSDEEIKTKIETRKLVDRRYRNEIYL